MKSRLWSISSALQHRLKKCIASYDTSYSISIGNVPYEEDERPGLEGVPYKPYRTVLPSERTGRRGGSLASCWRVPREKEERLGEDKILLQDYKLTKAK